MPTVTDPHPSAANDPLAGVGPTRPLAVVTGASSGIGLELAHQLAERGYDLLVVAEDATIDHVASGIMTDHVTIEALRVDLRREEGVERLAEHIIRAGAALDVVAINAGVGVSGPFSETSLEAELDMIRLNVMSVVHLAKRVVPAMMANGHGHLLFTSSVAADMPAPYLAVYGATKAFVLSFSEALRHELRDSDIAVTALQPGATDTNFFARAGMQENTPVGRDPKKDDPADIARDALDALFADKDKAVAGSFKNKRDIAMAQILPEPVKAAQHAKLTKPDR